MAMGSAPSCLKKVIPMHTRVRHIPICQPAQNRVEHPGRESAVCRKARRIGTFFRMSFTAKGSPAYSAGGQ
jgi:hypothetical protein